VGRPEEKDHLEALGVDGSILKWMFNKTELPQRWWPVVSVTVNLRIS
jgi:hypothetical protein